MIKKKKKKNPIVFHNLQTGLTELQLQCCQSTEIRYSCSAICWKTVSWSHHLTLNSLITACMAIWCCYCCLHVLQADGGKTNKKRRPCGAAERSKDCFCVPSEQKEARVSTGFGFSALLRRLEHGGQLLVQQNTSETYCLVGSPTAVWSCLTAQHSLQLQLQQEPYVM